MIPEEEGNTDGISYSLHAIEEMQTVCKTNLDKLLASITEPDLLALDVKDKLRLSRDLMSQFAYMEQTKISLHKQTTLSKKVIDLEEIIGKIPKEIILKYGINPSNSMIDA